MRPIFVPLALLATPASGCDHRRPSATAAAYPVAPSAPPLSGCNADVPRYPFPMRAIAEADLAARAAEFRRANPGTWDDVSFESNGYVRIQTHDPARAGRGTELSDDDIRWWNAFLAHNARFFGIVDCAEGQLDRSTSTEAGARQTLAGDVFPMGDLHLLRWSSGIVLLGHFVPIVVGPSIDRERVRARFVGRTYRTRYAWYDLGCVGARDRDCSERVEPPARVIVRPRPLGPAEVRLDARMRVIGEELRYVICVSAEVPREPDAHDERRECEVSFEPGDAPALPQAIDAVTGTVLGSGHAMGGICGGTETR